MMDVAYLVVMDVAYLVVFVKYQQHMLLLYQPISQQYSMVTAAVCECRVSFKQQPS